MTFDLTRPQTSDALTLAELTLYHQLMDYRADNGLAPIPLSVTLTTTAGRHAADTVYNIWQPDLRQPPGANLHSWSDAPFVPGQSDPEVMWQAPERIGLTYPGYGFEISASGYASSAAALSGWSNSPSHNTVILQTGDWDFDFLGIGIGLLRDPRVDDGTPIYHVWFGDAADPSGPPRISGTSRGDDITGTAFADLIDGGTGADRIAGNGGGDSLKGGGSSDTVEGGRGRDRLDGGAGDDILTGDGQGDRFLFTGRTFGSDQITDLSRTDRIILKAADEADTFDAFIAATTDRGRDLVYDLGGDGRNVITLVGIDAGDLRAAMFDFG
jgi:hypothetical protein